MNQIDAHVRWMLLAYPTLFRNRFDALAHVLTVTGGGYEWDDAGRLVADADRKDASPTTMVARYEHAFDEARTKAATNETACLVDFHKRRVVEAERELVTARHVAANVDVYASSYAAVSYRDAWAWLHYQDRHGIGDYWPINNPPANLAEDWRLAIREFLAQIMPSMNGLMGIHTADGWVAQPRYAAVFDWVMATYKRYESPADVAHAARVDEGARRIVGRILGLERAAPRYRRSAP